MLSHFIAFALLGIVQVVTAIWGGIVSVKSLPEGENRFKHYAGFLFLGVLGVVLILWVGVQTYQTEREAIAAQKNTQAKLDSLQLYQRYASEALSSRYPLGYAILKLSETGTIAAYRGRSSTDNYDFDMGPVKFLPPDDPKFFQIQIPDIRQRTGGHFHAQSNIMQGPKTVGWFNTYYTSGDTAAVLEVLDSEGPVLVFGLMPKR